MPNNQNSQDQPSSPTHNVRTDFSSYDAARMAHKASAQTFSERHGRLGGKKALVIAVMAVVCVVAIVLCTTVLHRPAGLTNSSADTLSSQMSTESLSTSPGVLNPKALDGWWASREIMVDGTEGDYTTAFLIKDGVVYEGGPNGLSGASYEIGKPSTTYCPQGHAGIGNRPGWIIPSPSFYLCEDDPNTLYWVDYTKPEAPVLDKSVTKESPLRRLDGEPKKDEFRTEGDQTA
ncbi:MAG: hypothetical protein IKF78_04015 [Atopobiaceae bacterium]|nr:hypothetical protein [Atopobiaceae bacterium]